MFDNYLLNFTIYFVLIKLISQIALNYIALLLTGKTVDLIHNGDNTR